MDCFQLAAAAAAAGELQPNGKCYFSGNVRSPKKSQTQILCQTAVS
jgi:hypothetical protein